MADAKVEAALQEIADRNAGRLLPEDVVIAAADPGSPLHEYFTWSNDEAAQKHRRNEARALIRSVTLVVTTETLSFRVPSYIRDAEKASKEPGYVAITRVKTEGDMARESAIREFERARSALTRAQSIAMYLGMEDEVTGAIELVSAMTRRIQEDRPAGNA